MSKTSPPIATRSSCHSPPAGRSHRHTAPPTAGSAAATLYSIRYTALAIGRAGRPLPSPGACCTASPADTGVVQAALTGHRLRGNPSGRPNGLASAARSRSSKTAKTSITSLWAARPLASAPAHALRYLRQTIAPEALLHCTRIHRRSKHMCREYTTPTTIEQTSGAGCSPTKPTHPPHPPHLTPIQKTTHSKPTKYTKYTCRQDGWPLRKGQARGTT